MSKVVFPQKPQTPLYAIRSCIADRANTVNRTEFENLKLIVNDSKVKCDALVEKTNQVVDATNALSERSNLMGIVFDSLFTCVYPTGTIFLSALPYDKFITYSKNYGVWGCFSGNWGWCNDKKPVTTMKFQWHEAVDPDTPEEDAEKAPIHEQDVDIYMYWCQEEEPIPEEDIPDHVPDPIPKIPTDDDPTETNP